MEAVECGAAALGIILGYYGRIVPLEELRLACGVSRDGSKASNLAQAARGYGLIAKGYYQEVETLQAWRPPFIVHWSFNHFLVVEGFGKDRVYLNDPATGPRTVTWDEFDASFTGVALTCEPGPEFRKGGSKPNLLVGLYRRLASSAPAVAHVVVAGLALTAMGLVIPSFTRTFVDQILVADQDWIVPLLVTMGVAAILRAAATGLQQHYLLRLEAKLAVEMAGGFLRHLLHLPVEFFMQRHAGDLTMRVAINDRVARLLAGDLGNALLNVVVIGFYALLMMQYDGVLATLGVVIAWVNFLALRYISRQRVDNSRRLLTDRAKLTSITVGGMQTIESIKATGAESDFFARWAGHHVKFLNSQARAAVVIQSLTALPTLLMSISTAVILTLGGFRVMEGVLSIGMLTAFQALMTSFLTPVNQMVTLGGTLQDVEGDISRLDDVLGYTPDPQVAAGSVFDTAHAPKLAGYLEVRGMTFGYSRLAPPLVEGLDLTLKPGERVALVGGSGSGKSTVARLVAGLYQPWEGEVLVDRKPRASIPRSVLTNSLAMVDQDIFLFEGTVRDNLTLWESSIPEADVVQAARDASIHADIASRPGGYDHIVEEMGRNFSGGQRQRLEIARALAGNPSLLVLDEATSALDPLTEQAIDEALRRRGCTCLIVAHRLSTIRDCDEIIVLERGKVVQRGSHDQMIRVPGPYATLIGSEGYAKRGTQSVLDRI
jgi:NHLM bacteriocin system ABC transporter peptidase/ATP-binding protein